MLLTKKRTSSQHDRKLTHKNTSESPKNRIWMHAVPPLSKLSPQPSQIQTISQTREVCQHPSNKNLCKTRKHTCSSCQLQKITTNHVVQKLPKKQSDNRKTDNNNYNKQTTTTPNPEMRLPKKGTNLAKATSQNTSKTLQ